MAFLPSGTTEMLVSSLITCGGDTGPLFLVAKAIHDSRDGDLGEIIPQDLAPVAAASIAKLEAEAIGGEIVPESVLRRYGSPSHFHDMNSEIQLGMNSVAREIPPSIRPVAHTLLPLREGVYENGDVKIALKGLVPLGAQEGTLVAHLAGTFACHCPEQVVAEILAMQAADTEFMEMAKLVEVLDYGGTQLQRATKRAKEALGL